MKCSSATSVIIVVLAVLAIPPRLYAASVAHSNLRLTEGRRARNIPFELYMNLIFLQVHVDEKKTLWFNLDSGLQTTVLDSDEAKALGLTLEEKTQIDVPGGTVELAFASGVSLVLPGVEMRNQRVRTIPLTVFAPILGRPIHGIIGHDLFNRFVVEIDYENRLLHLHEPSDYRYAGNGQAVPITIESDQAFIQAQILQPRRPPIGAKLKLDTGSVNELGLNGSFVKATSLLSDRQKVLPQPGVALGGITENYVTRVRAVRIGRLTMRNPVAGFSKDLERGGDAGTIGGEFFRRFKAIFDYSRKRLILEKNRHFDEPYPYDSSGLFLSAAGAPLRDLKVLRVIPDTPAHEAGIRDGDVIATLNGQSVEMFTLEEVRRLLTDSGGTVRLGVRRNGHVEEMAIRLRRLI